MKNKVDLVIKLIITAAIIVVLVILALPALEEQETISPGEQMPQGENPTEAPSSSGGQRPSGAPSGGEMQQGGRPGADTHMPAASAQAVNAAIATRGTVSEFIKVNGDVVADAEIDIYPDVSGKIIISSLSVGDWVNKGQSVAVVDPSLPGQNFAESDVYSTISGTVLAVNVQVGDKVSTNSSVVTVGDLSKLKLETYIPEKYSGNIRIGLPADVSFAAYPDELFDAEISTISPVLDPESRTLEVELDITNKAKNIKSGMFASIKLVTNQVIDVITIPAAAVFSYYGDNTVFVVKNDNTVERRTVKLGMTTVEFIEIASGLSEGEIIVTGGQSLLKEGTTVKIASMDQE